MKKKIKIKVTEEFQEDMNVLRREIGLPEEEVKPEYELEALFG